MAAGRIKVLFVSPERLNNPHLLEALRPRMPLPLVVVDEAHCVAGAPRGRGCVWRVTLVWGLLLGRSHLAGLCRAV